MLDINAADEPVHHPVQGPAVTVINRHLIEKITVSGMLPNEIDSSNLSYAFHRTYYSPLHAIKIYIFCH